MAANSKCDPFFDATCWEILGLNGCAALCLISTSARSCEKSVAQYRKRFSGNRIILRVCNAAGMVGQTSNTTIFARRL
jgi:hypothetical protein